jgi:hypothetical protein
MNRSSRIAHLASVGLMGVIVLVATGVGFAQSYAGLYHWALQHGLAEWKAQSFPLLVDLFIAVGELGLFALALEGHRLTRRGMSWADFGLPLGITVAGWIVSLVFNIGAVRGVTTQATHAVPPIASMLGLFVLLRTLHRLVSRSATAETPEATTGCQCETTERPVAATRLEAAVAFVLSGATQRAAADEFKLDRGRLSAAVDQALNPVAEVAELHPAEEAETA